MCHGSALVRIDDQVPVVAETTYRVMNIADAPSRPGRARRIAALAPPGSVYRSDGTLSCVACFKERTPVSIEHVPLSVQRAYGLPRTLSRAWLVPGGAHEDTDYVYVKGCDPITFAHFISDDVRITALPAEECSVQETPETAGREFVFA